LQALDESIIGRKGEGAEIAHRGRSRISTIALIFECSRLKLKLLPGEIIFIHPIISAITFSMV